MLSVPALLRRERAGDGTCCWRAGEKPARCGQRGWQRDEMHEAGARRGVPNLSRPPALLWELGMLLAPQGAAWWVFFFGALLERRSVLPWFVARGGCPADTTNARAHAEQIPIWPGLGAGSGLGVWGRLFPFPGCPKGVCCLPSAEAFCIACGLCWRCLGRELCRLHAAVCARGWRGAAQPGGNPLPRPQSTKYRGWVGAAGTQGG